MMLWHHFIDSICCMEENGDWREFSAEISIVDVATSYTGTSIGHWEGRFLWHLLSFSLGLQRLETLCILNGIVQKIPRLPPSSSYPQWLLSSKQKAQAKLPPVHQFYCDATTG